MSISFGALQEQKTNWFGKTLSDKVCQIRLLSTEVQQNGFFSIVLGDSSAEIEGALHPKNLTDEVCIGAVVTISAAIINHNGDDVFLKVTKIAKAENYNILEIQRGLSAERVAYYTDIIKNMVPYIKHEGFRSLVLHCLTPDTLKVLAYTVSTLHKNGHFPGAALQETAIVTQMVKEIAKVYLLGDNQLYTRAVNWSAVLAASLLHQYGNIYYYEAVGGIVRKSAEGLNGGYLALMQSKLQNVILQNDIPLTPIEFTQLINILGASVAGGNPALRAVTKEGELLKVAIHAFATLDLFDAEYYRLTNDNLKREENERLLYEYSDVLGCQMFIGLKEEDIKQVKKGGTPDASNQ